MFDRGLPSHIGHLRFVAFRQPEFGAVSEADRVRFPIVFHRHGCNIKEREALFAALFDHTCT